MASFMSNLSTSSLLLATLIITIISFSEAANFNVGNNCPYPVWAAASPVGGRRLDRGQTWSLEVPAGTSGARTGCGFDAADNGRCDTGDCGAGLNCRQGPSTLAEFLLDVFDPLEGFPFGSSLAAAPGDKSALVGTRIDWKETAEAHVFKADLPGLKKEEVKVEVEEGKVLQISGERSKEHEDKNDKWHRLERTSGKFVRRFRLPENARLDQVKASMENGVLTVTVPKEEVKKPEVKAIDISG